MSSLYKRATPRQHRILRIVAGAVKNALDAHPDGHRTRNFARSVAKRAAGTLTAAWPEVLAAPATPSDRAGGTIGESHRPRGAQTPKPRERGAPQIVRRPLVPPRAVKRIGVLAGAARRAGELERERVLVEVLRLIARETS